MLVFPWVITGFMWVTNFSKSNSHSVELGKRKVWMEDVQDFVIHSTDDRFGHSQMVKWQEQFCKSNGLKPIVIAERKKVDLPVMPDNQ